MGRCFPHMRTTRLPESSSETRSTWIISSIIYRAYAWTAAVPVGWRVKLAEGFVMKPVDLHLVLVLEIGRVPLLYGLLLRVGAGLSAADEAGLPTPDDSGDEPGAELGLEPEPAVY